MHSGSHAHAAAGWPRSDTISGPTTPHSFTQPSPSTLYNMTASDTQDSTEEKISGMPATKSESASAQARLESEPQTEGHEQASSTPPATFEKGLNFWVTYSALILCIFLSALDLVSIENPSYSTWLIFLCRRQSPPFYPPLPMTFMEMMTSFGLVQHTRYQAPHSCRSVVQCRMHLVDDLSCWVL